MKWNVYHLLWYPCIFAMSCIVSQRALKFNRIKKNCITQLKSEYQLFPAIAHNVLEMFSGPCLRTVNVFKGIFYRKYAFILTYEEY